MKQGYENCTTCTYDAQGSLLSEQGTQLCKKYLYNDFHQCIRTEVIRGDGLNLYAFCANNPVMYVDPSGYKAKKCGTGGSEDNNDFDEKWKTYLDDIEKQTGIKIPENQKMALLKELNIDPHNTKLVGEDYTQHRKDFNTSKEALIKLWEKNTGLVWPTYTEDVISKKSGEPYILAGSNYDAHEIIPNVYNSPLEWWNLIPASNPKQHQAGIHRKGAPIKEIFK